MPLLLAALGGCDDPAGGRPRAPEGEPCEVPGAICTWVGIPEQPGFTPGGAPRTEINLYFPTDIEQALDGSLLVTDLNNHRVVEVGTDGDAETLVGTGLVGDGAPPPETCWDDCDAATFTLNHPSAAIPDPAALDVVWVTAWQNGRIVRVRRSTRTATWWAGTGRPGDTGGERDTITLNLPSSVAPDPSNGDLFASDSNNQVIRRIRPDGAVDVVAGQLGQPGYAGDGCDAADAWLDGTTGLSGGPGSRLALADRVLYAADTANGVIRAIDLDTNTIGTVAGRYVPVGAYAGDGWDARAAVFHHPTDVAVGADGSLYVADTENHCVRRVDPVTNVVETFAGTCTEAGFAGDEGPATEALLFQPGGVAVDNDGDVLIADTANSVIRRVRGYRTAEERVLIGPDVGAVCP